MNFTREHINTKISFGLILLLHLLFSIMYHLTLFLSIPESRSADRAFFSWSEYIDNSGIQFLVMLVGFTIIWLLLFKVLHHWPLPYRLSIHLLTLPVFVWASQQVFYFLSEQWGYGHLEGNPQIWDIFIPALFYLVLFGFFHAWEYYRRNQYRMAAEAKWQADALQSELKAIKAQLNPHFLYNVFNTINASIPKAQEGTRELIADLSDLLRYQLKASEVDSLFLSEEIEAIKTYLRLEKQRFGERLQVTMDIDPACLNKKIPPMLIQPLVENAIKHSMNRRTEGLEVHLRFAEGPNNTMEVKGFGLRHTKQRLERFYGTKLHLKNSQPGGLTVQFTI
ncbi:MAG: sensor histidine kinase [Bacteroidetes bacterium]|jgi:hypothetical protein|nr:sensor histidine kinase [Bacteroidota bacterium]